ncbi:MAG TPA: hypothetical protein VKX46_14740 [Ktedonobacteraceae bacterium]|nr:hypothetical protein [Ktedonobacteraceae bacterium]
MAASHDKIAEIQAKLQGILGQRAWGVARGQGSFVTMEFEQPVPPAQPNARSHGEWHLWLYGCAWRLEQAEHVIVASEDDLAKIETAIRRLEGHVLQAFELTTPAPDAVITFDDAMVLRLFAVSTEGMDSWLLYTPDKVITVGPAGKWSYED